MADALSIQPFANAATRDAKIPFPTIGQGCFLWDSGALMFYFGTPPSWQPPWNTPFFALVAGGTPQVSDPTGVVTGSVDLSQLTHGIRAASVNTLELLVSGTGGEPSASWVDLTTPGPSVTVTIGPSGRCLILASAACEAFFIPTSAGDGSFAVLVDGVGPSDNMTALHGFDTSGWSGAFTVATTSTPSLLQIVSNLTPGAHTFKMVYRMNVGTSSHFSNRTILALPY